MTHAPNAETASIFEALPSPARARLLAMRAGVLAAAEATGTSPLTETLKWGQPAYLPSKKQGTTIRLGWSQKLPETCTMYVHCQTRLIDQYRERFPTEFIYDGTRAAHVPVQGPWPEAAFQQIAAMALTYHRDKTKA